MASVSRFTFQVPSSTLRPHCRGCRKRGKTATEPGALATGELLNYCENWTYILPSLTFGAPLLMPSTSATPSVIGASDCPVTGQATSRTGPEAGRNCRNQGNVRGRSGSDCVAADRPPVAGTTVTAQQRGSCRKLVPRLGAGALAPHLIRAHSAVRPIQKVFLFNRTRHRALALADQLSEQG